METRICRNCEEKKVIEEFEKTKEGRRWECFECRRIKRMEYNRRDLIPIICANCKTEFLRSKRLHNVSVKENREEYCSVSCSGKRMVKEGRLNQPIRDEFSPFRPIMTSLIARGKLGRIVSVSLQDLKEQWDKQNGCCPYTGIQLITPKAHQESPGYLVRASVDRIDSKQGYIPGNIEFVSTAINFLKNKHSKELIEQLLTITVDLKNNRWKTSKTLSLITNP